MSLPQPRLGADDEHRERDDVELLAAMRVGDKTAYALLYERHVAAARRLALHLTRSAAEADDLVSEAFAKMLDVLSSGGGPKTAFRAYLLTTVRNTLYDRVHRDRRLQLSDDMTRHDPGEPWVDPAITGLESTMAARAFARLPERWQTVLWHTEVEQESPAEVALLLGLTPNGVSALAYRAREGLRQAYLREHVSDGANARCGWTIDRLGARVRGGLSRRDRTKVDSHLLDCPRCRALAGELDEVNSGLRGIIAPVVLGGAAAAYLASSAKAQVAVAVAGSAAGATAVPAAGAGAGAGGSTLGAVAGWVAGTAGGKATAAAVVAVAVGGAVAGVGKLDTLRPPPASAEAATGEDAGLPKPAEAGGVPTGTAVPGFSIRPGTGAAAPVPGSSGSTAEEGADRPGAPGATSSPTLSGGAAGGGPRGGSGGGTAPTQGPAATGSGPGTVAAPPATGRAVLDVGSPVAVRALRQGKAGEIGVTIRNVGTGPAAALVATVRLPSGFAVRAGSSNSPADWHCTGAGQVATCSVASLPADGSGTARVKVFIADDALAGVVTGQVTGSGGLTATIPSTVVPVTLK